MEQSHKNNDCYFFYYSTCTKGDSCQFRHEPSALGCEVMCSYWQQGNCLNEHCNFRHMELKKNRKSIACYWETQRGGCKKPHCPFLHTTERPGAPDAPVNPTKTTTELPTKPVGQEWSNRQDDGKFDGSGTESDQGRGSSEAGSFIGSPAVDPLIVNFDEESDSEGVAPTSPLKTHDPTTTRVPYCKTYEEIRLEEIQAESAAYYSYEPHDYMKNPGGGKDIKVSTIRTARQSSSNAVYTKEKITSNEPKLINNKTNNDDLTFKVLTLDEIKRRKNIIIKEPIKSTKQTVLPIVDALKTVKELEITTKSINDTTRKRSVESTVSSDDHELKRLKIQQTIVPPIRLRRSPKHYQDMSNVDKRQLSPRKNDIQVRLCDSSTSDDSCINAITKTIAVEEINDKKNNSTNLVDPVDDLKLEQLIDEQSNDDDYLDTASDDILKDIDAMLTEKSV